MKEKFLRLLIVMTISITALFALGITASAATAGDFTITLTEGGGDPVVDTDYTYADGVLTILSDKDITIKNTNPSTSTTDRIEVADGVSANITIAGVNIDVSGTEYAAAFQIADNSTGNVTITLADGTTNTLKSGKYCAGLQKNGAYISETQGKLTITGTCSLIAPGGSGAGIGGGISRSTITAIGGERGAGIGGGHNGSGSNITITISGGTVTATGDKYGAGIGGGFKGSGSYITISDGTVTATGGFGAGIGGGMEGNGSNIEISGGTVTAPGDTGGAGIGGGYKGSGSNIEISGGEVTAIGNIGAGIGGGEYGSGSNIDISGGKVTATGGTGGASIGGGLRSSGSNIEISGGSVKAVAGTVYQNCVPAAIGQGVQWDSDTGVYSNGAEVTPTDGNGNNVYLLELTSATSSLKIDGKDFPINHGSDGKVYVYLPEGEHTVISDGNSATSKYAKNADNKLEPIGTAFTITGTDLVYGTDYTYPADTGVLTILSDKDITIANADPSSSTTNRIEVAYGVSANITLDGVNINVRREKACAFKIADDSTGDVTIILADNSENTLKSGTGWAGLQKNGRYSEELGTLTIQGGELGTGKLIAQGGDLSAGIGDGDGCNSSNIEISGGTVTATGGSDGVGIGGFSGSKNIEISGGVVHASTAEGPGSTAIGSVSGPAEITISGGTVTTVSGFNGENGGYAPDIGSRYVSGSIINITGGSIKINGANDNPFYGITPIDGNRKNVYLFTLDNPNNEDIIIDGVDYPDKHSNENRIYAYLPNDNHIVEIGDTTKYYIYNDGGYQCYNNYADIWMDCERYSKPYDGIEIYTSEFTVHLGDEDITDNENIAFTFYDSEGTLLGSSPVDVGEYTVRATYDDGETFGMAELEYEIVPGPLGTINIFGEVGKTLGEVTKEYIPEGAPEPADPFAGTFAWADGLSDSTVIVAGEEYEWTFTAQSSNYAVLEGTFITYGDISDPTELTATGGEGKVTLNWTSNSTAAAPYEAYSICVFETMESAEAFLHTSEQEFIKFRYFMDDAEDPITSYEIDGLSAGTTYYFVLMADPMGKQEGVTSNHSVYATASDGTNVVSATTSAASSGGSGGSSSSGGGSYGGGGSSSYVPENPEIGGKPASWTTIADDISKLPDGSETTIELNGNYDVPVSVIKAIAEKDMKVTFVIDSTKSWIIDGAEIEDPEAADLKILTIASVNTSALRGDVGAKFRIDGTNAPTELEITFAKKNEGKFANLYKKDGDKLVFVDNARVDENGKVILSVSEKGDYVIMLCEFSDRRGDVSNDGLVTPKDASSILKDIVALEGAANPVMLDYNGDGVITPKDASDILKDLVFDVI